MKIHPKSQNLVKGKLSANACILKPTANWSPYILTLVQEVKNRVYKIHVVLSGAILCRDSEGYFI